LAYDPCSMKAVPSPAQFFGAALAAFERAREAAHLPSSILRLCLGGTTVEIEALGSLLSESLAQALGGGGPTCVEAPSTRIFAWDAASTGVACPPPPWGGHYVYTRRGDVLAFQDPRYRLAYNVSANVLSLFDRKERLGLYWTENAAKLPGWEITAPLRTLLHWQGLEHGLQLTHGAVVGEGRKGLLLVGKGGSGKSTTALSCLEEGMAYLSDDYCYCSLIDGPVAHRVYTNARIYPETLTRLPSLGTAASRPSDDKIAIDVTLLRAELREKLSLVAIVLPELRSQGPVELLEAGREECLKALIVPTMAQLPDAGPQSFAILQGLANALPAYSLSLLGERTAIVNKLRELLAWS
jgi:hypothetical protein